MKLSNLEREVLLNILERRSLSGHLDMVELVEELYDMALQLVQE